MKFVVDEIARITFPKGLRGYSEEEVNDFLKKIRADYQDYDLQLEEKDKEYEAQEKRFIDQHKVKRREFDQALQDLSLQLERNKNQIARLEAEAQRLPAGDLEFRLNQALGNLVENQRANESLKVENAGYQAQLDEFRNRPSRLAQLEQEFELVQSENQTLQAQLAEKDRQLVNSGKARGEPEKVQALQEKLTQQESELAELRAQLEELKNVRPTEITTILANVQGLADSVLQEAERKRTQILAEAQASAELTQQEAEKQRAAIYQQAEREQTEVRKAFEKDRSQELSELALINARVKEKETESSETDEKLQALNSQLAELSQNKEASQMELNQVRERAERLRRQLIHQFTVVIETLKNEEI